MLWPSQPFAALLDFLYPRDCMACGTRLPPENPDCLCAECMETLPRIGDFQCSRCGNALGPHATGVHACASCDGRKSLFFRGATAACQYDGAARELVHRLKYNRDLRAAAFMAKTLSEKVHAAPWSQRVDAIVPVPLHWTRRLSRRFNQSELLAKEIARHCGWPVISGAVRRIRRTESQARLAGKERLENVRGVFRINRSHAVAEKRLLLVDDVMSTCATAAECSRTLIHSGARAVHVAVFAR